MYLEQRVEELENQVANLLAQLAKAEEPKAEQTKTLDDVRAAVTQVMKADKTKKQALQALLKKHGADRVSELDESKFAIVIDTIEKGEF